jgi:glycosyltransferase involved in cell wall biosynthesis
MEDDSAVPAKQAEDVWAIYAGMLGHTYDVYTLMDAARILSRNPQARNIRIIVAGDGPLRRTLVDFISQHGLRNLIYVGVLDMPGLCRLYARSDIGLCIYAPGSTVVIPAKAFDYYAAALPIVNSLEGEFADYLREQGIGVQYKAGDPVSLASSLVELASNPRRRELMRRRLEEVASVFDRDQQYAKVFDLLPPGLGQTVSTRNDCHHT